MKYATETAVALLAAGCLAPAAWMTANREAGYDVVYRSYQELQATRDGPRLAGLSTSSAGVLDLRLEGFRGSTWRPADDAAAEGAAGGAAQIPLRPGLHRRVLTSEQGEAFALTTIAGADVPDPLVSNASAPMARDLPYAMSDFVTASEAYDPEQLAAARELLQEIGVGPQDRPRDKVVKIARYLHQTLLPHRGQPTPRMRRLSGYAQYQEALAGRSGVYCANHAEIFAFFAVAAGVPTRLVDVGREFDGFPVAAHAFAESYLADESRWAYVDLQLHAALLTDVNGRVLNGIDVLLRSLRADWRGVSGALLAAGKGEPQDAAAVFERIQQFVPPEATLTYLWASADRYSLPQRLHRLLVSPQPAFSMVLSGPGALWRLAATYTGLMAGLVLVLRLLFRRR